MNDASLALEAARAGAAVVRDWAGRIGGPDYKAADDPVTQADREAEAAILGMLRAERPADVILSEEGGTGAESGSRCWIVDPLDGTVNFISGIPHVGVSVALYDGDQPLVGVVVDVFRGDEFTAERGGGAHAGGVPIRVSERPVLGSAVVATGFPYDHKEHDYTVTVRAVLAEVQGIRRMGAAALDFAWVAAGRYDGFWELGLSPWDVAAGLLLVAEAGGTCTGLDGSPATVDTRLLVASNGKVHEQLLGLVAGNLPEHLR